MSRQIDADALLAALYEADAITMRGAKIIREFPAVEEKHGRWSVHEISRYVSYGITGYEIVYECSACGLSTESPLYYDKPKIPEDVDFPRYCPNCGAKMDGGQDE